MENVKTKASNLKFAIFSLVVDLSLSTFPIIQFCIRISYFRKVEATAGRKTLKTTETKISRLKLSLGNFSRVYKLHVKIPFQAEISQLHANEMSAMGGLQKFVLFPLHTQACITAHTTRIGCQTDLFFFHHSRTKTRMKCQHNSRGLHTAGHVRKNHECEP